MKINTLVKSAWPGRGIGMQCLVIKRMRSLLKKREYQHNYCAKLSAAAKSKKFLASKVNMSGMIVIYFFNRLNIFYFILIAIYVVSNMSYIR
jgi:hypothetical protein